jgi:Zn-dependent protease
MVSEPNKTPASTTPTPTPAPLSPGRIWAEQLAIGMGLLLFLLAFMAFKHPTLLSIGMQVLTAGDLLAYGWASVIGVALHFVVHEAGTLVVAWRYGIPLRFRFFPFGVNAAATLSAQPRRVWIDAMVGLAGPLTGTAASLLAAAIYHFTDNPFFLGMACVGYFYNLFTLIPILDLEGGWIAPAIAPQAWLLGLISCVLELTNGFNLALLGVVTFGLPRLILLIWARAPREDLVLSGRQRLLVCLTYFIIVLGLAWLGTQTFEWLGRLVPEAMGD